MVPGNYEGMPAGYGGIVWCGVIEMASRDDRTDSPLMVCIARILLTVP